MSGRGFLERPEGVGFWTMMLLILGLIMYSYVNSQAVDWSLILVFIIALLFSNTTWVVFAWRRPSVPIEKVERISFWMMILLSSGLLVSEYLTNALFNYRLFYVFIAGLLAYYAAYLLRTIRERRLIKRS